MFKKGIVHDKYHDEYIVVHNSVIIDDIFSSLHEHPLDRVMYVLYDESMYNEMLMILKLTGQVESRNSFLR